jgi:hypothetical protein
MASRINVNYFLITEPAARLTTGHPVSLGTIIASIKNFNTPYKMELMNCVYPGFKSKNRNQYCSPSGNGDGSDRSGHDGHS